MVSEKNPNAKDSLDDVAAKGQRILASWWLLETLDIWIICLPRVAPASHTQPCVLVLAMVGRERGEYARHRHSLRWLGFLGDLLQHPLSSNPTPIQPLSSNNHLAHQCNNLWYRRKCWKCLLNSKLMVKTCIVDFLLGVLEQKLKLPTFPFPASLLGEIWKSDIIWWSKLGRAFAAKLGKSHFLGPAGSIHIPKACALLTTEVSHDLQHPHTLHFPTSQSTQHPLPSHPTSFPWGLACWSPCLQMWVGGGESSRPWGELFYHFWCD